MAMNFDSNCDYFSRSKSNEHQLKTVVEINCNNCKYLYNTEWKITNFNLVSTTEQSLMIVNFTEKKKRREL